MKNKNNKKPGKKPSREAVLRARIAALEQALKDAEKSAAYRESIIEQVAVMFDLNCWLGELPKLIKAELKARQTSLDEANTEVRVYRALLQEARNNKLDWVEWAKLQATSPKGEQCLK